MAVRDRINKTQISNKREQLNTDRNRSVVDLFSAKTEQQQYPECSTGDRGGITTVCSIVRLGVRSQELGLWAAVFRNERLRHRHGARNAPHEYSRILRGRAIVVVVATGTACRVGSKFCVSL